MRCFPIFAAAILPLVATFVIAADRPAAPTDRIALKPPQLLVQGDDGKSVPLALAKVEADTVIRGFLAQTTELLTFRNDGGRVLEGDLDFPLPEGAVVSGYGLDVDGAIVDGVPVPKQEARVTFEKEVRKGVDPGLVEQTAGNGFRTRVYPIRPHGTRTVKVQYVADLGDRVGAIDYRLPMRWGKSVGECVLRVRVEGGWDAPQVLGGAAPGLNLMKDESGAYAGETTLHAADFDADLVISLGNPPPRHAEVEQWRRTTQTIDEIESAGPASRPTTPETAFFFSIHDAPPALAQDESISGAVKAPRVGVYWDVSLSRLQANKEHELALLAQVLAKVGATDVDLIPFSNVPQPTQSFHLAGGDVGPVVEKIKALIYDGGTNLSLLAMPKSAAGDKDATGYDVCLLFTDGLANLGEPMPHRMDVPVYTFTNDAKADHDLLRRIAAESGGAAFNLLRMTDEQVLASFDSARPYSLLSVETTAGEVADVYPRTRQPVAGRMTVAGRLVSPTATVVLHYGVGGVVTSSVTYALTREGATDTGLVPRFWGRMKVADLSASPDANAGALADVGRQFNLVTPNTSLIVLENVNQYLAYRIVPPQNRPEVYAAFVEQIRKQAATKKQDREERMKVVLQEWNDRVAWWEKTYEYPKDFKWKEPTAETPATQPAGEAFGLGGGGGVGPRGRVFGHGGNGHALFDARSRDEAGTQAAVAAASPPAPAAGRLQAGTSDALATDRAASTDDDGNSLNRAADLKALGKDTGEAVRSETIAIKPWDPQTPYLAAMQSAGAGKAYAAYLEQRKAFGSAPAFFVDAADFLIHNNQRDLGVRVLTNVVELKLDDPELLRIAAYKLREVGERDLAIDLFNKVLKMRPEEPQSYRDLALTLADRADATLESTPQKTFSCPPSVAADDARALDLLNTVVMRQWDRFQGIELIALEEANAIVARTEVVRRSRNIPIPLDPRLLKNLDLDVRVSMTWDTDATDVDLWVTEPTGEKCFYGHNRTTVGGLLSNDFTQGYGPEEYCLRRAMPGKYLVQANFYGDHNQSVHGPTTVQATVITRFGRPDEKRQTLTFRLTNNQDVVDLGTVTVGE